MGAVAVLFYSEVFARSGLGELFAGLGLGALPVWGAAWVQGQEPGAAALWAGAPAFFMTFDLLLLNEFPDEEADRGGGRRNLVLLLGRKGAALVYAAAALLTPASIVTAVAIRALPALALVAVLPSLLLAKPLAWAFGDRGNRCRCRRSARTSSGTWRRTACSPSRSSWRAPCAEQRDPRPSPCTDLGPTTSAPAHR